MTARPTPFARALIAATLGCGAGCTNHDTPAAAEPVPAAEQPSPAEDATATTKDEANNQTATSSGPRLELVGVVHEDGTRVCEAETGDEHWIDRHWQVGWTPLVVEADVVAKLPGLKGRVVKVGGRASSGPPTHFGPTQRPSQIEICPVYQMRSDWVHTLEGMRIARGHAPELDAFAVDTLELVEPLKASLASGEVSVTLTNPFDGPLRGVEVVAHYEGCYGKPGATSQTWRVGKLAAGASPKPHAFPAIVTNDKNPRGRDYALRSLELLGHDAADPASVLLDLEQAASRLEVGVECPDR